MSSNTKDKSSKRSFGIIAVAKRKKSKKKADQRLTAAESAPLPVNAQDSPKSGGARTLTPETTTLVGTIDFTSDSMAEDYEARIAELTQELQELQDDLDSAEDKIDRDSETIEKLKEELEVSKEEAAGLREKVSGFEKVSGDLDDASYDAAQEFQLKQQIEKLQADLDQRKNLEQQLLDTKVELQDVRSQLETLQFQKNQSTTRSKMQNLREEKSTKEEVARLQKDLRAMERKLQYETSHLEAQVKATQDSLQRAQEKIKVNQQRFDEVDKERLQFKIENQRLEKKLEQSDSYTQRKRLQTEQETAELELSNLKRKNAKLERRLSMSTQMLNLIDEGQEIVFDGDALRSDSRSTDITTPTAPTTLSEAKIINLEKELQQLDVKNTKLTKENDDLKERVATAEQSADVLSLRVKQLDEQLMQEKETIVEMEEKMEKLKERAVAAGSGDLQEELERLEKALKENETKFHVKEKDLWSTIEAQKKQIQELEMEKLKLELGEDEEEEGGDNNAIGEVEEEAKEGGFNMRERLQSLQVELETVQSHNMELQQELEKQKKESEEFVKSLENELEQVNAEESAREETLIKKNEELRQRLEEKSEQYEDAIREITHLKDIIDNQVYYTVSTPSTPRIDCHCWL